MKATLSSASLADTLRSIIIDIAEIAPDSYDLQSNFKADLGLDSLDMVEMIMICEKDFLIHLPDHEWTHLASPGDLLHLIEQKYQPVS
ncbi:MAG: acyl carrier protein [Bacteroidota bacterium]